MIRPTLVLLMAGLLAVGCTPAPTPTKAQAALQTSCRSESEATYNRQNRDLLSTRETTDTPYSTSGVSGITTRGLSREYNREVQLDNCLRNGGGGNAQARDGTAFSAPASIIQGPPAD